MSPEDQEQRAREHAREKGLKIGIVLPPDLDESGGKWERPGLQKALVRVREGKSGGIIVADLDRLTRDAEHGQRLLREIDESGGAVYAPNAPDDMKSPEGELQVGIWFLFAQYERKKKRAGFERAKKAAIEAGIPVATRPPVGYRQRADRRLEPDPDIAPIIRELFERRAAGEGPSALADFLERHGVHTSQGSAGWSKQAVASVIASRVYLGELSYGKDRRYVNPKAHDPIVDLATWTAAQHPNGHTPQAPRGEGEYLLSGIVRCASCGYAMQATHSSHRHRIYRCIRRHSGGTCPSPARVRAEVVEAVAERAFWDVTDDLRATAQAEAPDLSGLEEDLARAEGRLAQAKSPEVQDAAGDGWAEMIRTRRLERDAAAEALGRARAERRTEAPADVETLRAVWDSLDPADKRELMATKLDLIALRRDPPALIVFPAGTAPDGLSRRGFRRNPGLHPIDVPTSARVLPLEHTRERVREIAV
jgi:DNA invertase Pin-like site-specific DNA recombinase